MIPDVCYLVHQLIQVLVNQMYFQPLQISKHVLSFMRTVKIVLDWKTKYLNFCLPYFGFWNQKDRNGAGRRWNVSVCFLLLLKEKILLVWTWNLAAIGNVVWGA